MAISNKIKALLKLKNKKAVEYSNALNLSNAQAMNTKFIRNSFKTQDLIVLAELTGTELAFIDKETGKPIITFDTDDIKKPSE